MNFREVIWLQGFFNLKMQVIELVSKMHKNAWVVQGGASSKPHYLLLCDLEQVT